MESGVGKPGVQAMKQELEVWFSKTSTYKNTQIVSVC